jgi:Ca2+-binding EF-hand superfamily protein
LLKNKNNLRTSIVIYKLSLRNNYIVSEKELQKLYKNFSKIDKDKSGMLEPEEFFDIPGI